MIGLPSARHRNLWLRPRIELAALDKERSFLVRVVGFSKAKSDPRANDLNNHSGRQK